MLKLVQIYISFIKKLIILSVHCALNCINFSVKLILLSTHYPLNYIYFIIKRIISLFYKFYDVKFFQNYNPKFRLAPPVSPLLSQADSDHSVRIKRTNVILLNKKKNLWIPRQWSPQPYPIQMPQNWK
jgi:hypothetical protein